MKYGLYILLGGAAVTCLFFFMVVTENEAFAARQFYIERPRLGLELSYNFEYEDRQGPYSSTRDKSHAFSERFDIQTGGWAYHPAVLIYSLRLSPEWQQTIEKPDPGREGTRNSFLPGYSLDLTFLQYKPYTLSLFTRSQRSVLTSSFAARSETVSDTYGATLKLKYKVLPTTLAYLHTESDQTGFYESEESRDEVRLTMRHEEKSNDTSLNAAYMTRERTTLGITSDTKSLFGGLNNIDRITPDSRILLTSNLIYRQAVSDFFSSSGISLSESLRWRHASNFSTLYNISYNRNSSEEFSNDSKSVSAGASHTLYENLVTTASANAAGSSAGENTYGGNLNFDYSRRIPWGMLSVNIGHDYRVTQRSLGEVYLRVVDEPHLLTTGDVTFLNFQNVDLNSIVVANTDHSIVYMNDIDYTVETIGTSVRLSRTSFGVIAEGQEVRISYLYLSNPAFDSSTFGRSYGLGLYLWSALRVNYRYSHSKENFLSGIPPDVLNEDKTQTADAELKWKGSTTRLIYEDSERTSGVSVKRWRVEEQLVYSPLRNLFWGLSGYYGRTKLKETGSDENFYGFRSDLQWAVAGRSKVKVEGFYGKIDGTSNRTVDKGGTALIEWFYGIWSGNFSYRFLMQEDLISGQRLDRHSILFRINRTLF